MIVVVLVACVVVCLRGGGGRPLEDSFTPQFCFFWRPFTPLQCDHGWTGARTCLRDFRVVALSVQPMASIQESGVVDGETANEH